MMKRIATCVLGIYLILGVASVSSGDQETQVKELVKKAVAFYKAKGMDYTIKTLNSLHGPFRKKDLYVYAMDFNGVLLATPANQSLVGKNLSQLKDAKGNPMWPPVIDAAKREGSGWTEYWWRRHGEKEATLKRVYIECVPNEEVIFCSGYYVK